METLPSRLRHSAQLGLLLTLLCAPGCVLDQVWTTKDGVPGAGHPTELATAWLNRVQYAPDVAHDGSATPGLVCRMYLFDKTLPVVGEGSVLITLFDDTHGPAKQPLEQWHIDAVTLRKFIKKDAVGWGYTLFLPWGSCRPDVTKVHLTCRFDSASGTPLFGPVTPLTLEYDAPPDAAAAATPAPPAMMPQVPQLPMPSPLK